MSHPESHAKAHFDPCECAGAICALACNPIYLRTGYYCRAVRPPLASFDNMVLLYARMQSALRAIGAPFPVTQPAGERLIEICKIAQRALNESMGMPL